MGGRHSTLCSFLFWLCVEGASMCTGGVVSWGISNSMPHTHTHTHTLTLTRTHVHTQIWQLIYGEEPAMDSLSLVVCVDGVVDLKPCCITRISWTSHHSVVRLSDQPGRISWITTGSFSSHRDSWFAIERVSCKVPFWLWEHNNFSSSTLCDSCTCYM